MKTPSYNHEPGGANLAQWRAELLHMGHPLGGHALGNQLGETTNPYATIAALKLPAPKYVAFETPDDLLGRQDPLEALLPLRKAGITHYHVALRPYEEGLPKYRNIEMPLALKQVVPYITEHIPSERNALYSLRIAEYAVAAFGVVLVVNPSGFEQADIVVGDVGPLATGHRRPDYQARTHPATGIRRYTTVDPEHSKNPSVWSDRDREIQDDPMMNQAVRQAISGAIDRIPRIGSDWRDPHIPGRFEIAVVEHQIPDHPASDNQLVPIYLDAQPDNSGSHPYAVPEPGRSLVAAVFTDQEKNARAKV